MAGQCCNKDISKRQTSSIPVKEWLQVLSRNIQFSLWSYCYNVSTFNFCGCTLHLRRLSEYTLGSYLPGDQYSRCYLTNIPGVTWPVIALSSPIGFYWLREQLMSFHVFLSFHQVVLSLWVYWLHPPVSTEERSSVRSLVSDCSISQAIPLTSHVSYKSCTSHFIDIAVLSS